MAGPLVAAEAGGRAAEAFSKALRGDFFVVKGQVFRKIPREVRETVDGVERVIEYDELVPIDLEAHVNPISIGVGLVGATTAVVLGLIAWGGLTLPTLFGPVQLFPGLKDTEFGQRVSEKYAPPPTRKRASCAELHDRWRALRADPLWWLNPLVVGELRAIEHDADLLECAWRANP